MKVLFIMLIVVLLVAFAVPVFANKDGFYNENALWGQAHKILAETGSVSEAVHGGQVFAETHGTNFGQLIKEFKASL